MIIITQLVFVKEGKEKVFQEYENKVLPLLSEYNGKLLYRIRPNDDSYVYAAAEKPYELHIVTFNTELDWQNFVNGDERKKYIYLKEQSVKSVSIIKSEAI